MSYDLSTVSFFFRGSASGIYALSSEGRSRKGLQVAGRGERESRSQFGECYAIGSVFFGRERLVTGSGARARYISVSQEECRVRST